MIERGEEWGTPARAAPDFEVAGDDEALAQAVARHPGALVRFRPTPGSDLARAIGLDVSTPAASAARRDLAVDALRVGSAGLASNMVVVGAPPDRCGRFTRRIGVHLTVDGTVAFDGPATTVIVATGQFLRGFDVVPRGHPGDGRAEVQVYALRPGERAAMRGRLAAGQHVPHPRIVQRSGRRIDIRAAHPLSLEVDGRRRDAVADVVIEVVPGAYRLLV